MKSGGGVVTVRGAPPEASTLGGGVRRYDRTYTKRTCHSFLQWLHVSCEWLLSARNPELSGLDGVQGVSSVVAVWSQTGAFRCSRTVFGVYEQRANNARTPHGQRANTARTPYEHRTDNEEGGVNIF